MQKLSYRFKLKFSGTQRLSFNAELVKIPGMLYKSSKVQFFEKRRSELLGICLKKEFVIKDVRIGDERFRRDNYRLGRTEKRKRAEEYVRSVLQGKACLSQNKSADNGIFYEWTLFFRCCVVFLKK
jgi:hypothetical protein